LLKTILYIRFEYRVNISNNLSIKKLLADFFRLRLIMQSPAGIKVLTEKEMAFRKDGIFPRIFCKKAILVRDGFSNNANTG